MKKLFYLLFTTILFSQNITAQTKTWNGSASTDWYNPSNWTPTNGATAGFPTATDEAIINTRPNQPSITTGNAVARRISMNASTTLSISASVTLTVVSPADVAITMSNATITNGGTIIATNNNPSFVSAQSAFNLNTGAIVNNSGSITMNGNANEGLRMAQGNFNNLSGGTVVANGYECIRLANANAFFTNSSGATLTGTGSNLSLNINGGNFNNFGMADFTGGCEIYASGSGITNLACGQFKLTGTVFIQTTSSITNAGYFYVSGTINVSNTSALSNTSVLRYGSVTGTVSGSGNGRVIVNNASSSPTPIFTYGSTSFNGTINGIFTDIVATISAGTYTGLPSNTFVGNNTLPAGSQTLYAKITPSGGACFYIVPFTYSNLPSFSVHPISQTVCVPDAVSFSVVAAATTSYQWQVSTDGGTNYNNIMASSIYSNETTATLNISNPTGLTTHRYRCVATNSGGSTNSNAAILTVITPVSTPTGTLTWTGTFSTDWNLACNWSPASVPTAGNDVVIANTTNKPTIGASYAALAKTVEVQASAILTLANAGSLTVNGSKILASIGGAFHNLGTVQNNGLIVIGSTTSSGAYCIVNKSTFNNNTGGEIRVDNATSGGIYNHSSAVAFTNVAKISVGLSVAVAGNGIFNDDVFNNNAGGEIKVENVSLSGIFNRNGTFTNVAKITIGATTTTSGILNDAIFNNNVGGEIVVGSFYHRTSTFNNFGLLSIEYTGGQLLNRAIFNNKPCGKAIVKVGTLLNDASNSNYTNEGLTQVNNSLNNSNTFTNIGVLIYGSLSGTITNVDVASIIVNNNPTNSTIFTYGGTYNGTVNGIFTNVAATSPFLAGTFTAPNTFVPSGTLPGGSQTLYAKVTPNGGACFYVVPFTYVATTPPPAFTTQPMSVSVCNSVTTSFSVVATNANAYQWQISINGGGTFTNITASSIYTNVTATTLNISNPTGLNANQYRCVATGTSGVTNSNAAVLLINPNTLTLVSPTDNISINAGTRQATQTITATNKVISPATVIYRAGNSVQLNTGFEARSGAVFAAQIGGCN